LELLSSSSSSAAAGFEEMLEGLGKGFGGAEAKGIDAGAAQGAVELGEAVGVRIGKFLAHRSAGGVDFEKFAGFGIFDGQKAGGGQEAFARVMEVETDEVVADVGEAKFLEGVAGRRRIGLMDFWIDGLVAEFSMNLSVCKLPRISPHPDPLPLGRGEGGAWERGSVRAWERKRAPHPGGFKI